MKLTVNYLGVNDNLLSLRGIAAMAVLIFHAMLSFKVDGFDTKLYEIRINTISSVFNQLIVLLFNGSAAVIFFFCS